MPVAWSRSSNLPYPSSSTAAPCRLLILGAGSFAEDVADWASDVTGLDVAGFVVNLTKPERDATLSGKPIHWIDNLPQPLAVHRAVCSIGTNRRTAIITAARQRGLAFTTLCHPTAYVAKTSNLARGVVVAPGVIAGAHTSIGEHTIVGRGALIGHHTRIGRCVTVGPGANIAGKCEIEDGCYIGMGAVIRDHTRIGKGSVVGAGAVVVKQVPAGVQVVGNPARITQKGIQGL